ncbi:NAD(P)-binding protein [Mytilinidion resinicola]|uniref:NAD(P)-binding protein n=1 Tax=Mytilinidion resinicola TaxID=574789 RepID=A0A6A6Z5N4_9PEZI|nr:NAD(P)-binding protein [Mytilinidion resinicola]KAF2815515.1 NAD(P)-binding protein [Mytilinidion resinicola]
MSNIKNVVIIGASGNLGPTVLNQFVNSPFNVTVFSRKESNAVFPESVKVIKTDFSSESLSQNLAGQDAVICTLGGVEGFRDQARIIDAAIAAGVKRFIPSEFGSDTTSPEVLNIVPAFGPKVETIDYLKSKESEAFSWTSVIPGLFFDWGSKFGSIGFDFQNRKAAIWDGGDVAFSATNTSTVGLALVRSLSAPNLEATRNRHVFLASHTVTQNEMVTALEKLTGQSWEISNVDSALVIEGKSKEFRDGNSKAAFPLIQSSIFGKPGFCNFTGKTWNEKLGLPKEDFEADLKDILEGRKPEPFGRQVGRYPDWSDPGSK